jgi:hypothetical protein
MGAYDPEDAGVRPLTYFLPRPTLRSAGAEGAGAAGTRTGAADPANPSFGNQFKAFLMAPCDRIPRPRHRDWETFSRPMRDR